MVPTSLAPVFTRSGESARPLDGIGLLWLVAAIWIAALLLWYRAYGGDAPIPPPEQTYLGLTASVYHLVGLYGGLLLALLSAFGPVGWLETRPAGAEGPAG